MSASLRPPLHCSINTLRLLKESPRHPAKKLNSLQEDRANIPIKLFNRGHHSLENGNSIPEQVCAPKIDLKQTSRSPAEPVEAISRRSLRAVPIKPLLKPIEMPQREVGAASELVSPIHKVLQRPPQFLRTVQQGECLFNTEESCRFAHPQSLPKQESPVRHGKYLVRVFDGNFSETKAEQELNKQREELEAQCRQTRESQNAQENYQREETLHLETIQNFNTKKKIRNTMKQVTAQAPSPERKSPKRSIRRTLTISSPRNNSPENPLNQTIGGFMTKGITDEAPFTAQADLSNTRKRSKYQLVNNFMTEGGLMREPLHKRIKRNVTQSSRTSTQADQDSTDLSSRDSSTLKIPATTRHSKFIKSSFFGGIKTPGRSDQEDTDERGEPLKKIKNCLLDRAGAEKDMKIQKRNNYLYSFTRSALKQILSKAKPDQKARNSLKQQSTLFPSMDKANVVITGKGAKECCVINRMGGGRPFSPREQMLALHEHFKMKHQTVKRTVNEEGGGVRDLIPRKVRKNEGEDYDDEALDKLLQRIENRRTLTSQINEELEYAKQLYNKEKLPDVK